MLAKMVTNIIGKGLGMFDNKPSNAEPKTFEDKKAKEEEKEEKKSNPLAFNEGMS